MKKIVFAAIASILCLQSFSQNSLLKAPDVIDNYKYDSLENMPAAHIKSLCGQSVIALSDVYFHSSMNTLSKLNNSSIINQRFNVIGATRDEKRLQTWLLLSYGNDTVYYRVNATSVDNPTIIVVGYFDKQTKMYTGRTFKLQLANEFKELNTGIIKQFGDNAKFTCTGSTIVAEGKKLIPSFVLRSSNGDKIYTPVKGFEVTTSNNIQLFTIE